MVFYISHVECAVSVDGAKVDNLISGSKNEILSDHQINMTNSMSYNERDNFHSSAIFKGVLVTLLFSILFVGILAIMEFRVLKHQLQNDVVNHKHSTCDCNRLEDVMVSQNRDKETNSILDHQLIDAVYQTTNTWYLQLLIKSSINHLQVTPAFVSIHYDGKSQKYLSKPFFTFEEGHLMRMRVYFNDYDDSENTYISVFLYLMKGPHDDKLEQSGRLPLRGTFTIELLNPLSNYDHHDESYLISDDTCIECTKRVMQEGGMAKGYGSDFVLKNDLQYYYKNDTLYFRVSYNTCHSCVHLQYFSLPILMLFIFICIIDSVFIYALLVTIEFCRGLMETSNLVFGLYCIDHNWIKQVLIAIVTKKLMIIGILMVANTLTIVIWEFTGLITYHSANMTSNYILRILYISIYYQLVNTFSHKNVKSVVISPIFLLFILTMSGKDTIVKAFVNAFVNIIIMICNVYFVLLL